MDSQKYTKIISCCIVLTVICTCWSREQSRPAQSESEQTTTLQVGRDNPFAEILEKKSALQPLETDDKNPQLFLETISLKFLDARSLKAIIKEMLSKRGSVSVDSRTNSLIIRDTKENLEKILTQIQKADRTTAAPIAAAEDQNTPKLFVETVTLKFLNAKNLGTIIKTMSSEYGSISIDSKSNSLIICDTKENLEAILAQVKKADETPQQIMVEVVILDVQLGDDTEIGINWDILSNTDYDFAYRQSLTSSRLTTTDFATGNGPAGEFSVISGTIRNVVHLIQEKRNVEILASPRVMMVSGKSASIEAVDEIPYEEKSQTSEGGFLTYYAFKNVGIKLQVDATVVDNNDILLTVTAEQNVQVGTTTPPRVDTRKAESSLLLKDGQIIVLGGLRRQEQTIEVDQIPFLGDLPIIGELFKDTSTKLSNSELIVFLSPHIHKGEPISKEAMAKFNEIKDKSMLSLPKDKDDPDKEMLSILAPAD